MIELRPPTLDDLPELAEFFARLEQSGGRGEGEGDVRDALTNPVFDIEANFRIALDDGRVVGWCDVWDQSNAHERLWLDPRASRDASDVYGVLFDWGMARAESLAVAGAVCRAAGASEDEAFASEVVKRDFKLIRHFFRMEIDLSCAPGEPTWPDGIVVRTFRAGDERAVYDAIDDAFADHWDHVMTPFAEWVHFAGVYTPTFDPSLWFIAEEDGELAGFSLCRSERRPGVGHVGVLGVRPHWRRRGLGSALLLHSFHELRRRGRSRVDLGVDAENTTGAVVLYERAGMKVARRLDSYEKALS